MQRYAFVLICVGCSSVPAAPVGSDAALPSDSPSDSSNNVPACEHGGLFAPRMTYSVGTMPDAVAIADVDGDGLLDLIVADESAYTPGIDVLRGQPGGRFTAADKISFGGGASTVVVGDFDKSGTPDVVSDEGPAGGVVVLPSSAAGLQPPIVTSTSFAVSIAAADLDHDGHIDVAVVEPDSPTSTLRVLFGVGDGTFSRTATYSLGANSRFVAAADLDGDGHVDLIATEAANGSAPGTVAVLHNTGDGTFAAAGRYGVGRFPMQLAVGDLDRDGKPDVVIANGDDGYLSVLHAAGDGFAAQTTYPGWAPLQYPSPSSWVALADVDGDGKLDIVQTVYYPTSIGHFGVLLGDGSGAFGAPTGYVTGVLPEALAVADVDGDGRPDVVTSSTFDNTVSVHLSSCM